jgi:hypothetical protein
MSRSQYQLFLGLVLIMWPLVITGLLFLMSRIEHYVAREDADSPREAGLESVPEAAPDREVRIFIGDRPVASSD